MDETSLQGWGVLVTRPQEQAETLCRLIEGAGGRVYRLPVLSICDPLDTAELEAVLDGLADYDIAVFISPNAVKRGLPLIQARGGLARHTAVAAVGAKTAKLLNQMGYPPTMVPSERFDSEALMALEPMQAVAGKQVVIFRGEGGREWLADTLKQRGATVRYAEVYRRAKPQVNVTPVLDVWAGGAIQAVTVTSNEGLRNLYDMVGAAGRTLLKQTPLVVISERGKQLAVELGIKSVRVSPLAADEAMVDTLVQWRRQQQAAGESL